MGYSVEAVRFTLKGDIPFAAGCICTDESADECRRKLNALKDLDISSRDLVGIDFEIAAAVCGIFSDGGAGDSPVVAAGCSVHIGDADIPDGMTTGGVLGDPNEDPVSSNDEAEPLKGGFNMMTLSGSPGLAADTDRGTINNVLQLIKRFKDQGRLNDEALLDDLFNSFGITTALLVLDGTGKGGEMFLAAKDKAGTRIYRQ